VLEAASRWELKDGVVYAGISSPVYLFYPFGGSLTKYMETEGNAIGDVDMWSKGARWAGVCAEGEAEQEAGTSRMGGRAGGGRAGGAVCGGCGREGGRGASETQPASIHARATVDQCTAHQHHECLGEIGSRGEDVSESWRANERAGKCGGSKWDSRIDPYTQRLQLNRRMSVCRIQRGSILESRVVPDTYVDQWNRR
jgi:hypothetical protein